jgi:tetratricopeptide (TPR) repeat protein
LRLLRAEAKLGLDRYEEALAEFAVLVATPGAAPRARLGRASALTLLGRSKEAKKEFASAAESDQSRDGQVLVAAQCARGLLHARDGEADEYHAAIQSTLTAGTKRVYPNRGHHAILRLETLLPLHPKISGESVVEYARIHAEASGRDFGGVLVLGAALYRAGRHDDAVGELEKAVRDWEARPNRPPGNSIDPLPPPTPLDAAEAMLFLAMARHRAGKSGAGEALQKAWELVQKALGARAEDGPPAPRMTIDEWSARARVNLLYKEAKELIGTEKK